MGIGSLLLGWAVIRPTLNDDARVATLNRGRGIIVVNYEVIYS
jgi:hypothetical protein